MQDQNKPSAASLFAQPTPETPAAPVSTTATEPAASTMPAASPFSPAYPPDIPVDTPVPEPTPPLTAAVQPSPAVDTPPAPAPTILDAPDEPANNPFLNSFNKPTLVDDSQNTAPPSGAPTVDDKLLDIKQNALEQLSPLVEHLEQSPEEKFKTTMMMLQATDNQALVQQAYDAANAIEDKKARAQALLDVVNEINYFTHQQQQDQTSVE